jgi:hypothetical protein
MKVKFLLVGNKEMEGTLVKENKKSVWIKASFKDDEGVEFSKIIKRNKDKHHVIFEGNE